MMGHTSWCVHFNVSLVFLWVMWVVEAAAVPLQILHDNSNNEIHPLLLVAYPTYTDTWTTRSIQMSYNLRPYSAIAISVVVFHSARRELYPSLIYGVYKWKKGAPAHNASLDFLAINVESPKYSVNNLLFVTWTYIHVCRVDVVDLLECDKWESCYHRSLN